MTQIIIIFLLFLWLLLLIFINYKYRSKIGRILNLIDKPDKIRKKHKFDVPLIASFPLLIIFFSYSIVIEPSNIVLQKILLLSSIFFIVGVLDDLYEISYIKKSILSVIILTIFLKFNNELLISKTVFEIFNLNIYLIESHSLFLTIICLIILVNTFNFTDGINGISSIIAILWLLSLVFLNISPNNYLIFFSICIFLNAIPIFFGKYFLGDSGTLFLGIFIGLVTIEAFNMQNNNIDLTLITSPHNFRYFTGLDSYFWESPTRPWFLLISQNKNPVAIIPSIGKTALQKTWIKEIKTWPSPQPKDEGVSELKKYISKVLPNKGKIGCELGLESHLRMSINDFDYLRNSLSNLKFIDASIIIWKQRIIKSQNEIKKLKKLF